MRHFRKIFKVYFYTQDTMLKIGIETPISTINHPKTVTKDWDEIETVKVIAIDILWNETKMLTVLGR